MGSIPGRGPNTPIVGNLQNLRQLQVDDPFLGPIFDARVQGVELLANERFSQHFWVHQEILIFFHPTDGTPKIALPESLAGDVIRSFHEQYGQFGITKVYSLMNRHFFLRKMRARIERFIKSCDVCQRCKFPNRALVGEMHPIIAENPGDFRFVVLKPKYRLRKLLTISTDSFRQINGLFGAKKNTVGKEETLFITTNHISTVHTPAPTDGMIEAIIVF
jgi:hypothetical protein